MADGETAGRTIDRNYTECGSVLQKADGVKVDSDRWRVGVEKSMMGEMQFKMG